MAASTPDMEEQPWVDRVHQAEDMWVTLVSLDADVLVEALSNLPADFQGRLEQIVDWSGRVRHAAASGQTFIVDTGLGTASWHLASTSSSDAPQDATGNTDQDQSSAVRSWADQSEVPAVLQPVTQTPQATVDPVQSLQTPVVEQVQPGLAQAQAAMGTPQPLSKKGTGKGPRQPPVKAMPQTPTAQITARTQVPPGQPPAKAQPPARVDDPPVQLPQPALQPGTRGVGPVAFPGELVGYNAGIYYAKWAAVGAHGLLPEATYDYQGGGVQSQPPQTLTAEVHHARGAKAGREGPSLASVTACARLPQAEGVEERTMASVSDSTVTFKAKATQHGVPEESLTAWATDGIQTYSQLLFRVASAPNAIDSVKLDKLLKTMKPPATDSVASAVNRLLFEAGTFVVAELRSSLEQPSAEPSRRLSTQERTSRLQALQSKLGSFRISGQYEPSHQLVDAFSSMISDQSVRHVPLARCSCREQEVSNVKKDEHLLRLENSALRLASKPQPLKVDLSTELRVAQALSRRGIAMEMAGIGTFEVHEAYARSLLEHLHRPPPPKFEAPGIDSLLRADRELWVRVAEEVGSEFTGPGKADAIDNAIKNWQHSMQVAYFLVPVPKPEKPEKQPFKRTWEQSFTGEKGVEKQPPKPDLAETVSAVASDLAPTQAEVPAQPDPPAVVEPQQEREQTPAQASADAPATQPTQPAQAAQGSRGELFLELFAGTARMSKAFARLGLQVLAVDSVKPSGVAGLSLDLAQPPSQKLVLDLLRSKRIFAVHLAPPCGTSSAARNIYAGAGSPQPLRSPLHPDGLPTLGFLQRQRVRAANRLYQFTALVIRACIEADICWSLENPQSSLFWLCTPIQSLWKDNKDKIHFGTFDSCVYGGARRKATTFWSSAKSVTALTLRCHPGLNHVHLPWGKSGSVWSTAEEAAYPQALRRHWAALLTQELVATKGLQEPGMSHGTQRFAAAERASLGLFPKATHAPVAVDPFQGQQWVQLNGDSDRIKFVPGVRLQDASFPKGSTTVKVVVEQGVWWALVGQPVEPADFLKAAVASQHPACSLPPLPEALERTVSSLSSRSLSEIHKLRCQRLRSLCDMARELQEQEDSDHSQLQPHLRDILKGKRLRLFDTILQGIGFPDKQLVRDMRSGFRITGWLPDTDTRPSKVVPPVMHREEVWDIRKKHNHQIWSQCKPSADPKLDRELWEQSLKECAQGWATLETGHTQAPENCVLGRRFPVVQGDKTRPIDDLSVSSVNSSLGSDEKIVVQPSSSTISLALHIQSRCLSSKRKASQPAGMKGRTFDLKTAFKQLGIATEDLPFAKVSVWNPDAAAPAVLALKALPFGATGSVHGFSRCSLAIWQIAVCLLLLPLTVFFDDYTSVTVAEDSQSVETCFLLLLKLLGWRAALDGSKAQSFAESFVSLGIAYILPRTPSGFVRVSNTEGRKQEVTATCQRALASGKFSPAECLAFAGRLRWLDAQVFGRKGRWAFRTILEHGTRPGRNRQLQLSPQLRDALEWVQLHVPTAKPRAFKRPPTKAYNVFTDGSFEAGLGRIGGVLCSPTGQITEWFQATVQQDMVQAWLHEGTSHPILQCEMLAVCVAAALWSSAMAEWPVTWWIDNDAVRHCLISARGFPESNYRLLQTVLCCEEEFMLQSWFARVPSASNPADAPSRGEAAEFLRHATEREVKVGWLRCLARGSVPQQFLRPAD
ncbi:URC1 [Symbiodinium sp. CCMP2592]|nr:URC1 [Symbiodinium sp. CCMP2592]